MTEKLDRACALCIPLVAKGAHVSVTMTQVRVSQELVDFCAVHDLGLDEAVSVGSVRWVATFRLPQEVSTLSFDEAGFTSDEAQDKLADAITTMLAEGK